MKKLLLLLVPLTLGLMVGCSYDDSAILDKIAEMEKEQAEMQAQLDAQQTLLDALANKLTITNIVQNTDGYTITFSDGTTATIKNGKDGDKGDKGDKGDTGAQGDKGEDGEDGDSFFAEVVVGTTDVTFTLADGTVVVIPLGSGSGDTSAEGNKIYYTTSDGKKLFPNNTEPAAFGAILVSNTYEEGQGVLTFDDTITSIGKEAFRDCSSLTSITIPDSVTTIGEYAFRGCKWLKSITIPDSVTSIGEHAFSNCASLTSVTIPDGVTSIKEQTFINCFSLTSVTIGNSVTEIGNYAFDCCSSLTSVTIPNSVTSIGKSAFNGTSLTSITIPNSVIEIGELAFNCCSSLTSVHITDIAAWCGITFGDSSANPLNYAHNLYLNGELVTDLVIPDSVTSIGEDAFYNCDSLTSVTIGSGVTVIGNSAFCLCFSLTSVYCMPTTPPSVGWDVFGANASGRKIYVPTASVEAYKAASYWSDYAADIVGYNF